MKEKSSAMKEKCTFDIDGEECNCILHCKDANKSNQIFNNAIKDIVEKNINEEPLTLRNIIFPNNFEYNKIFANNTNIQFTDCEFNEKIIHLNIKNIHYTDCHFKKDIWLFDEDDMSKTDTIYMLSFKCCIFEEEFNLDFSANNMPKCNIDTLDIQNSTFKKSIKVNKCHIHTGFVFSLNTVFGAGDFEDNRFIHTHFIRNKFNDVVSFKKSNFDNFDFRENTFDKLVIFQDLTFKSKLNLKGNIFKDEVNFLDIKHKDSKKLEAENIANRETARIIKNSFEKQNNIIEANKFYALEMEKRAEELKSENNLVEKFIFHIHGLSSNHSQDPFRVFLWIIIFGILSATIDFFSMTHFGIHIHNEPYMMVGLVMFIPLLFCIVDIFKNKNFTLSFLILFLIISAYSLVTQDFYTYFSLFAKTINPFSMMFSDDGINIFQLVFKVTFAYLYYQLIVSIRQNTRRK